MVGVTSDYKKDADANFKIQIHKTQETKNINSLPKKESKWSINYLKEKYLIKKGAAKTETKTWFEYELSKSIVRSRMVLPSTLINALSVPMRVLRPPVRTSDNIRESS